MCLLSCLSSAHRLLKREDLFQQAGEQSLTYSRRMANQNENKNIEDASRRHLVNTSKDYIDNHVNEDLHPGLSDSGFEFSQDEDCFAVPEESPHNDKALSDCQQTFAKAMQEYQEKVAPKYRVEINLQALHNWDEVIERAEVARNEYNGVAEKGILKRMRFGFRSFCTAAPAIEAWFRLLPSDSIYGSVLCGGIGLILGV